MICPKCKIVVLEKLEGYNPPVWNCESCGSIFMDLPKKEKPIENPPKCDCETPEPKSFLDKECSFDQMEWDDAPEENPPKRSREDVIVCDCGEEIVVEPEDWEYEESDYDAGGHVYKSGGLVVCPKCGKEWQYDACGIAKGWEDSIDRVIAEDWWIHEKSNPVTSIGPRGVVEHHYEMMSTTQFTDLTETEEYLEEKYGGRVTIWPEKTEMERRMVVESLLAGNPQLDESSLSDPRNAWKFDDGSSPSVKFSDQYPYSYGVYSEYDIDPEEIRLALMNHFNKGEGMPMDIRVWRDTKENPKENPSFTTWVFKDGVTKAVYVTHKHDENARKWVETALKSINASGQADIRPYNDKGILGYEITIPGEIPKDTLSKFEKETHKIAKEATTVKDYKFTPNPQ